MNSEPPSLFEGKKIIKRYVQDMPDTPGVYRMIASDGTPLYIGKAKNLRARVSNYVNAEALNTRLQRMVSQTTSMDIITTRSEAEALLLEASMVKKFLPRYNILLKDDKSFPYIFFSGENDFPRISKHRGAQAKKGKYFGPFVSGFAVNETITFLQKAFLIRPCSDTIFKNRSRPCLQYQIKRCSAPCVNYISKEEYGVLVQQAYGFLSGKSRQIQDEMVAQMQQHSANMEYEKARILRDRIKALTQVQQQQGISAHSIGDADVIAMARDESQCCIQLFSFRGGRNYGNKSWFPAHTAQASDSEIIRNFIGQFYQTQPVPKTILTSHAIEEAALLEEALELHSHCKVEIVNPQRGDKRAAIDEVQRNAKEALARHKTMHGLQQHVLEEIQTLFGLDELPARIEVYDNSHVSGTSAVGAMIVSGTEGFLKNEYRKFNIKGANPHPNLLSKSKKELTSTSAYQGEGRGEGFAPGDDYAMLREVLMRRFSRMQEEGDERKIPDLVLIDGGAGQLSVATQVFEELGISDIPYAAIAKGPDRNAGREQFFVPGKEPFQLPVGDPALHFLQRLRDEAHRFAIGTHRNKRSKTMQVSELDQIEGIGAMRKKALLMHFGSARAVAAASIDDIAKVTGINKATAATIYAHFHGQ